LGRGRKGRRGDPARHQTIGNEPLGVRRIFGGIVRFLARPRDLVAALGRLRLFSLSGDGCLDRPVLAIGPLSLPEAAVGTVIAAAVGVDDAVVVLGVLKIVLGRDAVAGGDSVARHGQVLFQHLIGVAADPNLGSVAVEGLLARIAAAAPVVRTARPAATRAPVVGSLSHFPIASGNRPDAPGSEAITPPHFRPLDATEQRRLLGGNRGAHKAQGLNWPVLSQQT